MKAMFITLLISYCLMCNGQTDSDDIDTKIHLLTTIVRGQFNFKSTQGSGFFYDVIDTTNKAANWHRVLHSFLITNRHLVLVKNEKGEDELPDLFTFYLRKYDGENLKWVPVQLSKEEMNKRTHVYADTSIDVAAIDVLDLIPKEVLGTPNILQYWPIKENDLPGSKSMLYSHVTDDVIIVGYPEEFYDDVNLFPIVKSGIIASRWGSGFKNKPYFLIDAKLFPGSSGSIVISKPTSMVVLNGEGFFSKNKEFSFLGIYSGKLNISAFENPSSNVEKEKDSSLDIGIVWYFDVVSNLVNNASSKK